MIRTRFAPSPTGLLHIGNVRTALMCFLLAKSHTAKEGEKAEFMLRLDDTDTERSTKEFADSMMDDLRWLGLNWDLMARQSDRLDRYNEVIEQLKVAGRLYPCFETPEELDIKRKSQLGRGLPPIYDRGALSLSDDQVQQNLTEGLSVHWRFKLDDAAVIEWDDLIKGPTRFEAKYLSDPVLIRANGSPTYMLPSTIDDMDFEISHVVRGEDHVSNTAIQLQLFEALGAKVPLFAHHSLMKTTEGKISKRKGGFDVQSLQKEGFEPLSILSLMSRIGTSDPVIPRTSLKSIIEDFDIKRFTKGTAIFDPKELERLNVKILHQLSFDDLKTRPELAGIDEAFYQAIAPNLSTLGDIAQWKAICQENLTPVIEDAQFTAKAASLLPEGQWSENTWSQWTSLVKQQTGRKGKELFMPLRLALTGQEHGPELKYLLPLIGKPRAVARLEGKLA